MSEKDERVDHQKTTFTDEEMAGLSETEREALLEEGDQDAEALRRVAGEGDDAADADAKAKAEADRKAAEDKAAADAKAKEDAAAARAAEEAKKKRDAELAAMNDEERKAAEEADRKAAEDAARAKAEADAKAKADAEKQQRAGETDDEDEPFGVPYKADAPADYEAKLKELDTREQQATERYKANEIEIDEMLREHKAVEAERRKLDEQRVKSEIAREHNEQYGQQRWQWEVNRFMKNVQKHEGIDYKGNNSLNVALDAEVRRLANDQANNDKTGEWFLETAHANVKANLGIKGKAAPSEDDKAREAREKAERERAAAAAANKDKLGKTLAHLPAAGGGELGGEGEFAHLDGLSGMELENAIARLSPEQQDRYARAS